MSREDPRLMTTVGPSRAGDWHPPEPRPPLPPWWESLGTFFPHAAFVHQASRSPKPD
jgi:hypothetical protein